MSLYSAEKSTFSALVLVLLIGLLGGIHVSPAQASVSGITIVSSGGDAQGSGWSNVGGVITATGAVSINASDLTSALAAGDLQISADSIDINSEIAWSASTKLTLSSNGALRINASIHATGSSASLALSSTPLYSLASSSGASIQLTGATPNLTINSQAFTVVNTQAQLLALTSSSTYIALGRSISLTDTFTDSIVTGAFTSVFDGLGNEVSGMRITAASGAVTNLGFFAELRGPTGGAAAIVRNFGVTHALIQTTSASTANNIRVGLVAGLVGDLTSPVSSPSAYSTYLTNVWSSGSVIAQDTGGTDQQGSHFAGGLVGCFNNGSLYITDSHSSASVSSGGTSSTKMAIGGLLGDAFAFNGISGNIHLELERTYSTGAIVEGSHGAYYGTGGLVGQFIADGTTFIKDSFSWSAITGSGASTGGIAGWREWWGGRTTGGIFSSYTTFRSLGNFVSGNSGSSDSYANVTNSTWTSLPVGFSPSVWSMTTGKMPILLAQTAAQVPLYVKVVAPTDGSYNTLSYTIVDATGATQDLDSLGLASPTGTAEYSIAPSVGTGTYLVSYVSGLTLTGANASSYYLAPYTTPTSVTITSALAAQSVAWAPTNTAIAYSANQLTPNVAATSSGSGAISYEVNNAGTTGCSVSAANPPVLSFSAAGDCVVRAIAAGTATEATAHKDVVFTITSPEPQSVTWTPTNTQVMTNASPLTPIGTPTTSGTGTISYSVESATTTGCSVDATTGVISFVSAGLCTIRATASSNGIYGSGFNDVTFTIGSATMSLALTVDAALGTSVNNATVDYASTGLQPSSTWNLVLRSTPQTLATGSIGGLGSAIGSATIPAGLPAGWHSLTFSGVNLNGVSVSTTVWFKVSTLGILLAIQSTEPSSDEPASLPQTGLPMANLILLAVSALALGAHVLSLRRRRTA